MEKEQYNDFELKCFYGKITEPKLKYYESGTCSCDFGMPLKEKKEDDTVWLNCKCWGNIAEKAGEELKKGDYVFVFGRFKVENFKTKENTDAVKVVFDTKRIMK